jgi:hypothetical protein
VVVWLIGWAVLIAEKLSLKKQQKFIEWLRKMARESEKKFSALILLITLTGCASTGNVQTKPTCPPMLREATYQAMQADELADYRIAVEECK